jgi:hypothetical protein
MLHPSPSSSSLPDDPHLRLLTSLLSRTPDSSQQILQTISEWKSVFSISWYKSVLRSNSSFLIPIWNLLFNLIGFPDATVSITSLHALGAFLLSLSPFIAPTLIETFRQSIAELPVSSPTSIAIISVFIFLSHFSGFGNSSDYIESIPVSHHFSVDFRPFIQHLPGLIREMSQLALQFHKVLLRSLLSISHDSLNIYVVESITLLLLRFPDSLFPDLLEYIFAHESDSLILAFGPLILTTKAFSAERERKMALFARAKLKLESEMLSAAEFEKAIEIITAMKEIEPDSINELCQNLWQRPLKIHSRRILMAVALNFEVLKPAEGDTPNDLCAKIKQWGNFSPEHDLEILELTPVLLERRDDVFISMISLFVSHPGIISRNVERFIPLLESILKCHGYIWVQINEILKLIARLNQFLIEKSMPGYVVICVEFIVSAALSPETVLAKTARDVAVSFVSVDNIGIFVQTLLNADLFDPRIVEGLMLLLNRLKFSHYVFTWISVTYS